MRWTSRDRQRAVAEENRRRAEDYVIALAERYPGDDYLAEVAADVHDHREMAARRELWRREDRERP